MSCLKLFIKARLADETDAWIVVDGRNVEGQIEEFKLALLVRQFRYGFEVLSTRTFSKDIIMIVR